MYWLIHFFGFWPPKSDEIGWKTVGPEIGKYFKPADSLRKPIHTGLDGHLMMGSRWSDFRFGQFGHFGQFGQFAKMTKLTKLTKAERVRSPRWVGAGGPRLHDAGH